LVGLLSGSLTSTPAFSAAKATVTTEALEAIVAVGHGIAYLFGVVGVVLFVQLVPKFSKANMENERAKLSENNPEVASKLTGKEIELDPFGFCAFSLVAVIGILIGSIKIGNFSLTTTGGCLLTSLIFGHFAKIGNISITPSTPTLKNFRELGLMLFLIGAGVAGGAEFVKYFEWVYFIYGIIMTMLPMIVGYIFARYVLKLNLLNNLGSICGGMTSTPALGTLISTAGTEKVAGAYASTYPIALISVVIVSQILILMF
jgi:putative transport protein